MGKLSAVADRIKDTKVRLEAEADKLAVKLDGIDKTAPGAFARGHAFIDAQAAEVGEIEDTLRQLSNLPLDGSMDSQGGSGKPIADSPGLPKAPQLNASQGTVGAQGGSAQSQPFPGNKV